MSHDVGIILVGFACGFLLALVIGLHLGAARAKASLSASTETPEQALARLARGR